MRRLRRLKRLSKRAKILVVGATVVIAILAIAITVMASGGASKSESAFRKEALRIEGGPCWFGGAERNTLYCAEEMQKLCEAAVGSGPHEPEERHLLCELASDYRAGAKKKEEEEQAPAHTPEEEKGRNESLEAHQRYEQAEAEGQKKVEEAETRVEGGTSIRKTEEKVCYESGKTSEECQGPLKETPQERSSEAENKAKQRLGEEEGGERVAPTPGCQSGGCVE